ncbi:MAG TPA: diguanylate cyclase [Longimicrobiales bacterium]|nr:diguanylate cyclase [Longimicrobiales bacterium]
MDENRALAPSEPGRILVVDDNQDNIDIISTRLQFRGYDILEASDGGQALDLVRSHAPDLILLDVMLPDIDGYEISRRIKGAVDLPYIPIILVTARDSTQDKVTGLDAGADDYLTKPINFPELEARVRSMLRIKRLQDELEEKNRELERLSISDGLTGLFNHRHIHDLLGEEWERVERTHDCMSVAMFDLDRFKAVNDTYGHQAGDRVLIELAAILRETARDIDRLGRYGGEEFMALLPETCIDEAAVFVERVRAAVGSREFDIGRSEPLRMTLSAGVASYPHPAVTNVETLVRLADDALYAAKAGGRDRVVRFDELEVDADAAPDPTSGHARAAPAARA